MRGSCVLARRRCDYTWRRDLRPILMRVLQIQGKKFRERYIFRVNGRENEE